MKIAEIAKPSWDQYFMALAFLTAMRSPDRQTKNGAVIVDWPSKSILATGYNGHPRGMEGLPTMRKGSALETLKVRLGNPPWTKIYEQGDTVPDDADITDVLLNGHWCAEETVASASNYVQRDPDKYLGMCHAETNALISCTKTSDDAVLYVPMPCCNQCAPLILNHPFVKIHRVVFFEDREYDKSLFARAGTRMEIYVGESPSKLLNTASEYVKIREEQSETLSADSRKVYENSSDS